MTRDTPRRIKGKLLLMDDDPVIRTAVQGLLENAGYTVTTCKDGLEAIACYKEALKQGKPFHVVIMDLNIPDGMGGLKAMTELRAIDPEVIGIVSSGYPNESVMTDYKKHGFKCMIEKPYKIEELDEMLEQVISGSTP